MGVAALRLDSYEGMGEAARWAMTQLRPGSWGWCRAMVGAIYAESYDNQCRIVELLSLLDGTEPEPDARAAYIGSEAYVSMVMDSAPAPMIRAHLDRMASCVDSASDTSTAVRRYFLWTRGYFTLVRYSRPWSALTDLGHALRLAQEVGDQRHELLTRVNPTELGWLEVGDLEGARQRMLALEERLTKSQEVLLSAIWARHLAQILCEAPDEQAWEEAEALSARALSNTRGMLWSPPTVQGTLARVALVRGQLKKAEELSRALGETLPAAPLFWISCAPVHMRALIGLGRAAEASIVAKQATGAIQMLGGAGCFEVEARLAAAEAFDADGDPARARVELGETLRQVNLRADDITDPFWRESYLTRNPYCARALTLGRAWGVDAERR